MKVPLTGPCDAAGNQRVANATGPAAAAALAQHVQHALPARSGSCRGPGGCVPGTVAAAAADALRGARDQHKI